MPDHSGYGVIMKDLTPLSPARRVLLGLVADVVDGTLTGQRDSELGQAQMAWLIVLTLILMRHNRTGDNESIGIGAIDGID